MEVTGYRFGPDDETAFESAARELSAAFSATPSGADLGWVAEQVLDFKWGYLDGDLSRWSPDDVAQILLELYPRKVVLQPGDERQVIRGFAALLRFLGEMGVLADAAAANGLARGVEDLAGLFVDAMADESWWGMGKRLVGAMAQDGIDVTDQAATGEWIERFNRRSFAERDMTLGPSLAGQFGGLLLGAMPAVRLAPRETLSAAAADTVWWRRVTRLVEYVGAGRPVTERGNLRVADGKALVSLLETSDRFDEEIAGKVFKTRSTAALSEVDLTYRLAVEAGLLSIHGRRVVPGRNVDAFLGDPLDGWYALFLCLLQRVGPVQHRYGGDHYGWGWYADELDAHLPMLLIDLYRTQAVAALDEMAVEAWEHLLDTYDLEDVPADKLDFHRGLVARSLQYAMIRLAELGVVELTDHAMKAPGDDDALGGEVQLGDLGRYAMQRLISRTADAPILGSLAECDAAELLKRAADLPESLARDEIDSWVADHESDGPVQLVAAMVTADDTGRGLAFRALLRVGADASDAVARLADDERLRHYYTLWRVDTLIAGPDETAASSPEDFIRLLYAVLDIWGANALTAWVAPAAGPAGVTAMLDQCWRVRRNETGPVLAAIGSHHTDKAIAKAARKSLFRHNSSRNS
ncbi:MAG TPA: hypothetical protein VHB18_05390 [Mycobacteriales bacterium]|nr:hypothetical protein [Mycobacteriales bacterium]